MELIVTNDSADGTIEIEELSAHVFSRWRHQPGFHHRPAGRAV